MSKLVSTLYNTDADREVILFAEQRKYMYGRMMGIISKLWHEKDPVGAFTVGPCYAQVEAYGNYFDLVDKLAHLSSAIQDVLTERARQDAKWGQQDHEPMAWMGILGEEFGELCEAVNETYFNNGPEARAKGGYENMRTEAVQVAAVAISFIEALDRRYGE
ncbi:MazG-like family protein [Paenibacillus sp. MB22_1]|uniref:MazG-like family protein n=1 Tax=Paenibacillus sp. MB22_1 TaxID=3383121 RepID=UPI0039A21B44